MDKIGLSIIIPSIRPQNWDNICKTLKDLEGKIDIELIFVGPDKHEDAQCRFVKDFGSPTRAIQLGSIVATKELMCWMSDDGKIDTDKFYSSVCSFLENSGQKDIMCLRYTENSHNRPIDYWSTSYHDDLRNLKYVPDTSFSLLSLMRRSLFLEIGGLDCSYKHCNMSCIDFSLRVKKMGGEVIMSPYQIFDFKWVPGTQGDRKVIHDTDINHDMPLFKERYSSKEPKGIIDHNNWIDSDPLWDRFK